MAVTVRLRLWITFDCWIHNFPQSQNIAGGKVSGFERFAFTRQNFPDSKLFGFQFRIRNLRRHDQTGIFSFGTRPLVCKRQNQSGTKTFRIHHESRTISSTVNLVLDMPCIRLACLQYKLTNYWGFSKRKEHYFPDVNVSFFVRDGIKYSRKWICNSRNHIRS